MGVGTLWQPVNYQTPKHILSGLMIPLVHCTQGPSMYRAQRKTASSKQKCDSPCATKEIMLKTKQNTLSRKGKDHLHTHVEIADFLALHDLKNLISRVTKEKVDF